MTPIRQIKESIIGYIRKLNTNSAFPTNLNIKNIEEKLMKMPREKFKQILQETHKASFPNKDIAEAAYNLHFAVGGSRTKNTRRRKRRKKKQSKRTRKKKRGGVLPLIGVPIAFLICTGLKVLLAFAEGGGDPGESTVEQRRREVAARASNY